MSAVIRGKMCGMWHYSQCTVNLVAVLLLSVSAPRRAKCVSGQLLLLCHNFQSPREHGRAQSIQRAPATAAEGLREHHQSGFLHPSLPHNNAGGLWIWNKTIRKNNVRDAEVKQSTDGLWAIPLEALNRNIRNHISISE